MKHGIVVRSVIPRSAGSPGDEESAGRRRRGDCRSLGTRPAEVPRDDGPLRLAISAVLLACLAFGFLSCQAKPAPPTIGVAFETLQTEFWVAAIDAIREDLDARHYAMAEAIADGDANRQLEQVRSLITRRVDGIVVVPRDAKSIVPMIKAANEAAIPIVLFNRPADASDARSTAVVADNLGLARATVDHLCGLARKGGKRVKAAILVGDLGDVNALGRRDGFDQAAASCADAMEVVARIPTEWNQEKAFAGVTNALQAHPDLGLIFTSSDFMLPSIASALKGAGRYRKAGEEGHVLLGGFDGDATAWRMIEEGTLDATGVQDVFFEAKASIQAVLDLKAGRPVPAVILDPGFVIHQGNKDEMAPRMWGAQVARKKAGGV
jgi:ABC-type sugar transport system substrate-binding protein